MRSFTREIGPEIPGSLFAWQAPGPLIHNYSQGNNLFPQNKHFRNPYKHQPKPESTFSKSPLHIWPTGGLINYILTVDDRSMSGCGCIFEQVAVMALAKCGTAATSALPSFWCASNQPIMTCQRRASKSSTSDEDLADCHMTMMIVILSGNGYKTLSCQQAFFIGIFNTSLTQAKTLMQADALTLANGSAG